MAFHNVVLPFPIDYGSKVNLQTAGNVVESASGVQFTSMKWSKFRWQCDLKYTLQDQTDYETLRNFFLLRNAMEHTFRVYDESSHSMTLNDQGEWATVKLTNSGVNSFQLYQVIASGSYSYGRKITKPIFVTMETYPGSGVYPTFELYFGGTTVGYKKTESTYTGTTSNGDGDYWVNYSTGVVTWEAGKGPVSTSTDHVYISCSFHIHAKFTNNELPASFSEYAVYDFDDISIIEVKE
jgi:hypothetical protein